MATKKQEAQKPPPHSEDHEKRESDRDPKDFDVGWLLDPADRAALLGRFPPRYPEVVAHHVTFKRGDRDAHPPTETAGQVVGEADDGRGVQALVVAIGGTTIRLDGSSYHITWSLGSGRMAKESNDVIRDLGWTPLAQPILIRLQPRTSES